jgi:acetolactate synthase-1/2/3 large subunit
MAHDQKCATAIARGGDLLGRALQEAGVRFLFTLCGGHISPILVGAKAHGLRVVDVRDEATAVFAADAVARLSGVPGVAAVTAGPGLTNTITALKNAQLAQSPLVLLGGAAPTVLQGRGALQDVRQRPIAAPNVKAVFRVRSVRKLAPTLDRALALARDGVPGPVLVECPIDLLYDEATVRRWYTDAAGKGTSIADRLLGIYLRWHVNRMFMPGARVVSRTESIPRRAPGRTVETVLAAIEKSVRPLMIVGSQAVVLAPDASRIAEAVTRLGVPVYLSGMARGLLGRSHGLLMRHRRREALRKADCVVLAGVPCDFRLDYGHHIRRSSTMIAANRSRRAAHLNRRPTIAVIGDPGKFLEQLAQRAQSAILERGAWIEELSRSDAVREQQIDQQARAVDEHVNPIALLRAIDRTAGENAVFVADGGDFIGAASYIVRPRGPLSWLDPGPFGTLGVGAGFALGAALCRPDAEVWLLYGDGACGYGLAELDTFVRHGIPVIAVVGNDAGWTQIAREQVKLLGDDVGTGLARTAYHEVARGFGAEGILVKRMVDVDDALGRARAFAKAGKPVLINAWLDRTDFREGSISM